MLLRVLLRTGTLRAAGGGLPAPSLPAAYMHRAAAALPAPSLLASRGVLPDSALPSPGILPATALSAAG